MALCLFRLAKQFDQTDFGDLAAAEGIERNLQPVLGKTHGHIEAETCRDLLSRRRTVPCAKPHQTGARIAIGILPQQNLHSRHRNPDGASHGFENRACIGRE